MLYVLLIIIAVGVLLISAEGKELLSVLWKLALIAGGLYLAFWVVILGIGFFSLSDEGLKDSISSVIGNVVLIVFAIYGVSLVYKKYQRGELGIVAKNIWVGNWEQHKKRTIFLIISFAFCAATLIYYNAIGQ